MVGRLSDQDSVSGQDDITSLLAGGNGTDFSLLFSAALSCQLPLVSSERAPASHSHPLPPQEISERFTSDLIEGVVSGTSLNCRESCSDLSSRHIIGPSLLLTCSKDWQLQLQVRLFPPLH